MKNKPLIRTADRTLGSIARSSLRNFIVQPLFALNYKVEIVGCEEALTCTGGSIVVC